MHNDLVKARHNVTDTVLALLRLSHSSRPNATLERVIGVGIEAEGGGIAEIQTVTVSVMILVLVSLKG
mgnify:CR=1 FL=1